MNKLTTTLLILVLSFGVYLPVNAQTDPMDSSLWNIIYELQQKIEELQVELNKHQNICMPKKETKKEVKEEKKVEKLSKKEEKIKSKEKEAKKTESKQVGNAHPGARP